MAVMCRQQGSHYVRNSVIRGGEDERGAYQERDVMRETLCVVKGGSCLGAVRDALDEARISSHEYNCDLI